MPAGADVRFSMWNDYVIEEDWDFGFVEVSTDGGTTWTEQKVYNAAGEEVTTPDDLRRPERPACRLRQQEVRPHRPHRRLAAQHVNLTPFAGTDHPGPPALRDRRGLRRARLVRRRLRGHQRRRPRSGATTSRAATNGWTATVGTFIPGTPLGAGWRIDTGTSSANQYYLAEWRNFDGFDEGLKYAYDTTYSSDGPWKVEKIKYNAPGMLVWYRDTTYGNANPVAATTFDLPSTGSKGGLLLVDSHFDPLRRTGEAADKDPSTLNNLRVASAVEQRGVRSRGATYPFKECLAEVPGEDWRNEYCTVVRPEPAVSTFTDAKGWYPGIEIRGNVAVLPRHRRLDGAAER